jgi:hypothetical protein
MQKVDDTAVLKRAKELCARNGAAWDFTTRSNKPILDQAGRRNYLALAWEQLLEKSDDAA